MEFRNLHCIALVAEMRQMGQLVKYTQVNVIGVRYHLIETLTVQLQCKFSWGLTSLFLLLLLVLMIVRPFGVITIM